MNNKEIKTLEALLDSVVPRGDLEIDIPLWDSSNLISKTQGGYTIGEMGILNLIHHRAKKLSPDARKLFKIKNGNPAYFRADLTSRGFVDYPFTDLVKYQGYWSAMKTAYGYTRSHKKEMKVCNLTKTWKKILGDVIEFTFTINEEDKLVFYTNRKGVIFGAGDKDYRTFKMEVEPECEKSEVSFIYKFSIFNPDTRWRLSSETTNPELFKRLKTILEQGEEE